MGKVKTTMIACLAAGTLIAGSWLLLREEHNELSRIVACGKEIVPAVDVVLIEVESSPGAELEPRQRLFRFEPRNRTDNPPSSLDQVMEIDERVFDGSSFTKDYAEWSRSFAVNVEAEALTGPNALVNLDRCDLYIGAEIERDITSIDRSWSVSLLVTGQM